MQSDAFFVEVRLAREGKGLRCSQKTVLFINLLIKYVKSWASLLQAFNMPN